MKSTKKTNKSLITRLSYKKKQTKKSKPPDKIKYNKTFILSMRDDGTEYNTDIFRNLIKKLGLTETKNPNEPTSYIHLQHMKNSVYDKKYFNTPTYLINLLDENKKVITNKYNLYTNFEKQYPEICARYMAKTWNITKFDDNKLDGKSVFIVRPVGIGAYSGVAVQVVTTNYELDKVLESALVKLAYYPKIIISEYIVNPMLWEGKKFHIRAYLLASIINDIYATWFYDFYEIFTAEKEYKQGDWHDMDIHDTHLKSVKKYILGPTDFEPKMKTLFGKTIYPQMLDCMKYVSRLLEGHAKAFDNASNAFEVFGCDFMITDDYKLKLLEVNDHTGLSMADFPDRKDEFCKLYFGKIYDLVLKPCFNPENSKKIKPLYTSHSS
jgi:hypothetical protein